MKTNMLGRIIYDCLLVLGVLFVPWWIVAPFALLGIILFPRYYECIVAGVLMDLLYLDAGGFPLFTPFSSFVYFLFIGFKKYFRMYE